MAILLDLPPPLDFLSHILSFVQDIHPKLVDKFSVVIYTTGKYLLKTKEKRQDTCAVNDPLGQTSRDHYSHLKLLFFFVILKCTDVQTPHAKIVITTERDCGSALWFKREKKHCRPDQEITIG